MLYIVYIAIDRDRAEEWEQWMERVHMPDVMDTNCFTDSTLARDVGRDSAERQAYRVVYRAPSKEKFDEYQRDFAPPLQQEHTLRYDGAFEASRDELPVLMTF